ncbi:MAG: DedA family protein [Parachlamydiaceae bacterium]|nr:DedA family protein [Parachlamydiaceae bacterium]
MEFLPDHETLSLWLMQYGSIVIFVLLALGIVALPVPEETLMVIAGILMRKGHLYIHETIAAAYLGSICGITMSYLIGSTAGYYVIHKYGKPLGLTEERLQKVHDWFEKFGKWTLFIGYFIPGVRHFTGFSAGMTKLTYKDFALFAYTGAAMWVTTFLSIGYYFGHISFETMENFEFGIEGLSIIILVLTAVILFYKYKNRLPSK